MKKKLEYFLHKVFKKTANECGNQIIKHIEINGVLGELVEFLSSEPTIKYFNKSDI